MLSFLKLIRIQNLLIGILSLLLLRFCILSPIFEQNNISLQLSNFNFIIFIVMSLLTAASGYIINDYYDIETDRINKPEKNIIGTNISVMSSLIIYFSFIIISTAIGIYLSMIAGEIKLGLINILAILMLWHYSYRTKHQFLFGNIIVALISSFYAVIYLWLFEFFMLKSNPITFPDTVKVFELLNPVIWSYFGFAFLVSVIREIIKDVEDIEGDKKIGSRTMPIILGFTKTKIVLISLIIICFVLLAFAQYYLYLNSFQKVFWYLAIVVQPLLIYLCYLLIRSKSREDYHFPGNTAKIIMLAGILSMQLFCVNF